MIMAIDEELIETIVARVWRTQLGVPQTMTPTEQAQFLAAETDKITDRIDELMPDTIEIQERYRRETGQQPDYPTTVGLINNARAQARQIALDELLFSLLTPQEEDLEEPELTVDEMAEARQRRAEATAQQTAALQATHQRDPERWINPTWCTEPSPASEALARTLWADRTAWFRVMAARLLQVLSEDGATVPKTVGDPAFRSCTSLVEAQLVAVGRQRDAHARQ